MISKCFNGGASIVTCDGRCDKAWGIAGRPSIALSERPDDYPDGKTGVPVAGLAKLGDLVFDIQDGAPTLPLKIGGKAWSMGWDIPTRYAIDADGQCWMDNAHGHPLGKMGSGELLAAIEDYGVVCAVREALGLEDLRREAKS